MADATYTIQYAQRQSLFNLHKYDCPLQTYIQRSWRIHIDSIQKRGCMTLSTTLVNTNTPGVIQPQNHTKKANYWNNRRRIQHAAKPWTRTASPNGTDDISPPLTRQRAFGGVTLGYRNSKWRVRLLLGSTPDSKRRHRCRC